MRRLRLKFAVLAGLVGVLWAAGVADAQATREYRDYQRAQREAEIQRQQYMMTRSARDYREWQRAQQEAQRELRDYQAEVRDDRRDRYGNYSRDQNAQYSGNMNRQYRYYRAGRYYNTDSRGAELLRQAVNSGYQQGFHEGQLARRYGRNTGYYNSGIYRNGTYGYQSYVDRSQYQYYFQQGFQRGYEDGYNSQTRYGYRTGNGMNILGNILNTILNFSQD